MSKKQEKPKITTDEEWKSQVRREKKELDAKNRSQKVDSAQPADTDASAAGSATDSAGGSANDSANGSTAGSGDSSTAGSDAGSDAGTPQGPLPPACFLTLVNSLAMQALYFMGQLPDQADKAPKINLDLAKHHIDTLNVLEEKTRGNLTDNESKALAMVLHEARMLYVQSAQT